MSWAMIATVNFPGACPKNDETGDMIANVSHYFSLLAKLSEILR